MIVEGETVEGASELEQLCELLNAWTNVDVGGPYYSTCRRQAVGH